MLRPLQGIPVKQEQIINQSFNNFQDSQMSRVKYQVRPQVSDMSMPNHEHTSSPTDKILEFKIDIPGKPKMNEPMNHGALGLQTPHKTINMNMSIP
jgi:hypothetical protein